MRAEAELNLERDVSGSHCAPWFTLIANVAARWRHRVLLNCDLAATTRTVRRWRQSQGEAGGHVRGTDSTQGEALRIPFRNGRVYK